MDICFENTEDMENNVNSFSDKRGNYDRYTDVFDYRYGKLNLLENGEYIFLPKR